jgi:hypothetical protein
MGFYWKDGKDQLMARSGDLPPSFKPTPSTPSTLSGHPLTSFTMNLRDPSVLEGPLDLARFLITSLTFMRTIRKVDMLVDDVPVLEVEKSVKGKEKVGKRGMRETSAGGMMRVKGVEETGMRISVKVMRWLSGEFDSLRGTSGCRVGLSFPESAYRQIPVSLHPHCLWRSRISPSRPKRSHRSSPHHSLVEIHHLRPPQLLPLPQ